MRIRGWHIEGFGLLHDFRVDELPNGLTVVLGPNEAGKTSLLGFIRGVLFGYPDRRRKDRQYPPLRGGRHGGRLSVESGDAVWTVERFANPAHFSIAQADGAPGSESDLHSLLGGVDAELHRNVFAFSLSELQEFETLQAEGVRDRIFAAGVVGAGRSARAAIDEFATKRADIGRKRGECRINGLRKRVEELDNELRQARARAVQHPELRLVADQIEEEQREIGRGLSEARREMTHLDALLAAWPDWDEQCQAQADLATLADTLDLAEDLGIRLDAALNAVRSQRERNEERRQAVDRLDEQLAALAPDDRLPSVSLHVKRLASRIGTVRARRERRAQLETQSAALAKRIEEEAPRLGAGWTSQSIREFDASIPAAQEIADWGERLRAEEQALRDVEEQLNVLTSTAQDLASEVVRRDTALKASSLIPNSKDLTERDAAVRRLRAKCAELVRERADLHSARQRVESAESRATEAQAAADLRRAEWDRRSAALRNAPDLPHADGLLRRERAVRELRIVLTEVASARNGIRSASQRAFDAGQRADEAEVSAASDEVEVERRTRVLAEARPVGDAESLGTLERSVRELRSKLVELAAVLSDRRAAETRLADRLHDTQRRVGSASTLVPKGRLLTVAVVLAVAGVVLLLLSESVGSVVAFGVAVLTAILATRSSIAPSVRADDAPFGVGEAEQAVRDLSERVDKLEGAASPIASRLGFTTLPDLDALDDKADEISIQVRARQDRDRESATLDQLRSLAQRSRESARRLRLGATAAQKEIEGALTQQLHDIEAVARGSARALDFTELPTVLALEEKATEVQVIAEKRRQHERELHDVEALDVEVAAAQDAAVRLLEECSTLRTEVEATHVVHVRMAEEATLALAKSIGFEVIPEPQDVEKRADELDLQLRARQERDRETDAVEEVRGRMEAAVAAAHKAADAAEECRRARASVQAGWLAWKAAHHCPEALRPETAQLFFAEVKQQRESLARFDEMKVETTEMDLEVLEFSRFVASLSEQAGDSDPSESTLPEDTLDELRGRVDADATMRVERARVAGELRKARDAQTISDRDATVAVEDLTSIFAEARASDERDCRTRIETSRRRADLKKRAREAEVRMRSRLGVGTQADAVRAELASGDRQGWEARKQECKGTLARLQPAYEDALRRHQDSVSRLTALEQECDVVTLATEREAVVSEIVEAVAEWRRLAIAQSLVQRTLRRYEIERQPAVLTRAAASFSRITEGRYTRLVPRENGIDLITADGRRFDAAALSRGAAEQLYLCLRLALAAEFGRLAVPLPLVMDDILVNFDPRRARLAAQVLLDAKSDHQILMFTCHPGTVELLTELDPGLRIVEIERQSPTPSSR